MKVVIYRITLLEPTLVTALDGDPNSAVAFNYLPGSALRGALIGKYLRQNNLTELDVANPDVRRLFFDATTRYLNGYPLDRLGKRTLPTPASWQQDKEDVAKQTPERPASVFDFAIEPRDHEEKQWQGVGKPFCSFTGDGVCLVHPERHIAVHTARTRRFGRAMPRDKIKPYEIPGAVYRYDAVAPGQTFEAATLCDDDADAATLLPLLAGDAMLGGSRSGGYGRVKLENPQELTHWREVGGTLASNVDGKLIVMFLSDVLLRDENGQFVVSTNVATNAIAKRLGVPLNSPQAFLRGNEIGGFNRKWGLPLPQVLAIQMGSAFVYDAPACDVSKLHELEIHGIGERRAEGFGRIAINWQTDEMLKVDPTKPSRSSPPVAIPTGTSSESLAKRMAERMLRQRLDERLVVAANFAAVNNPPSNAQLSRLRNIIHDELMKPTPNPQCVGEFLNSVLERNMARRQFERARVGNERLWDWINHIYQTTGENALKTVLGFQTGDGRKVGSAEPEITNALCAEYVLRFIDAVLARAAKENRKEM